MVACYQTCYANSTQGTVHWSIWKNLQPPTIFLHDAKNHRYWIASRHYACYRSNTNKLTSFQKVLVFSDNKQSFKPCPIVLFGVLLLCLDINSSHAHGRQYRVQRSLAVEVLTNWTAYKGHGSASYIQFTGHRINLPGYDNDIVAEHDVESLYTSLAFYSYTHFY